MEPRTRILPPEAGLHPGVPFSDYILWSALSQTDLKSARTMLHLRHRLDAVPDPAGPAQSKGTAFHTLLLEPDRFLASMAVCPLNEKTGESWGRGTAKWTEFEAENPGKTYISSLELRDIHAMAEAAQQNDMVRILRAANPKVEASAVWTDPEFGAVCKGRFDCLIERPDRIIVADFKTTGDASPDSFGRDSAKYGYVFQMAFYRRACSVLFPGKAFDAYIVAIESEAPYAVAVYSIDDDTLAVGMSEVRTRLAQYAAAVKNNKWPGYDAETPLVLPAWAYRQIESEGINGN